MDVLDGIARIEEYAVRGKAAFDADPLIQTWMVHHLQIIGEACRALPEDFRQRYSSVPWRQIGGMRNILVHDYFDIDAAAVWAAVEKDVPGLKLAVQGILSELDSSGERAE